MASESLKMIKKNKSNLLLIALIISLLAPVDVFPQNELDAFNNELEDTADSMEDTSDIFIRIVKVIAGVGSIIGLIAFIVYRTGNSDIAGNVGKWAMGIVFFVVGLAVVQKVFLS